MGMTEIIMKDNIRAVKSDVEGIKILLGEMKDAILNQNKEIKELKLMVQRRNK